MGEKTTTTSEAIDPRLVRKLADILNDTSLSEIEVERGDLKIRVARRIEMAPAPAQLMHAPAMAVAPAGVAAPLAVAPAPAPAEAAAQSTGEVVKSPMVGTIYLQPQPGSPSFVKIGDMVTAGQTLMIVEAMKTMNPVPAPRDGKLVEILVQDAQPVEYGFPLAVIE